MMRGRTDITTYEVTAFLRELSHVVPVLFVADEIQEYQKIELTTGTTGLRYLTEVISKLLYSKMLFVLSGTRYHILHQVGYKIGSPIRGKVRSIVVKKFGRKEIEEYYSEVKKVVLTNQYSMKDLKGLEHILKHYRTLLFSFSGGHPRSMWNITDVVTRNIPFLLEERKLFHYTNFKDWFLSFGRKTFLKANFPDDQKEVLTNLLSKNTFPIVRKWIIDGLANGLLLGPEPNSTEEDQDIIEDIIFTLMDIGVISQNGQLQYHLTSYFHLVWFLRVSASPQEQFLKEVLQSNFFHLLCGDHAGFGYTFENILLASLLTESSKNNQERLPLNPSMITGFEKLSGELDWTSLSLEEEVLYHTPNAEAIDLLLLQNEKLVVVQVSTRLKSNNTKLKILDEKIKEISQIGSFKHIVGWYISLYDFEKRDSTVFVTSGERLEAILTKPIFSKLLETKKSL